LQRVKKGGRITVLRHDVASKNESSFYLTLRTSTVRHFLPQVLLSFLCLLLTVGSAAAASQLQAEKLAGDDTVLGEVRVLLTLTTDTSEKWASQPKQVLLPKGLFHKGLTAYPIKATVQKGNPQLLRRWLYTFAPVQAGHFELPPFAVRISKKENDSVGRILQSNTVQFDIPESLETKEARQIVKRIDEINETLAVGQMQDNYFDVSEEIFTDTLPLIASSKEPLAQPSRSPWFYVLIFNFFACLALAIIAMVCWRRGLL